MLVMMVLGSDLLAGGIDMESDSRWGSEVIGSGRFSYCTLWWIRKASPPPWWVLFFVSKV